ncbi:hypothetical protein [Curtobacterium sp. MCPF17_031]|uniref:hypothetical protein n=1 Tax=Curtobacterium sp. MCPF17_031 TaxID=2175653 RepID=UPI000DA91DA6|nr:hypothetical protein [Curtobacterium sp. MCPF17_031]PZE33930.1 hypothetical protein DEJ31_15940 [Curtobacterium sp. MCPF17_031]
MTARRPITITGAVFAAIAGAISGTGWAILLISAALGGSFPFGAAFLVFGGVPFLLVGVTLLLVAASQHRRPRTTSA